MRQFCLFLCGALFVRIASSSFPKALGEDMTAKDSVEAIGHRRKRHHDMRQSLRTPSRHPVAMLELMSANLDNWGTRSMRENSTNLPEMTMVRPNGNIEPVDEAFDQTPFDEAFDQTLNAAGDHVNPLAQLPKGMNMFDTRSQQAHPLNFAQYSEPQSNLSRNLMLVILLLVVLLMSAYFMSIICSDGSEGDEDQVAYRSPKEGMMTLSGDPLGRSTWAAAYAEAEGPQKEAFELLFRCNMISTEEFSLGVVDQEHIQECTWIATHMLQHKPLEEWVGLWQQAQQSFEDSVADCFEARGGQAGLGARALAQRLTLSRSQFRTPSSPSPSGSRPSSANLDFVSDASLDLRPLHS